ncbi:hypothetical protein BDF20DRAFT_833702 [Mycotypha africana]|uniref:uncharacterized protein n=1 Tax=Mycotypha africana TaxID=64632 RepID=UPI0023001144|nr:uncharacterized protein BDF20DRAFT_833702 [Mycotypha africana]KAI8984172.1 hypothetical protein BDF20DRAFT_833702 [Mycotypha africana]
MFESPICFCHSGYYLALRVIREVIKIRRLCHYKHRVIMLQLTESGQLDQAQESMETNKRSYDILLNFKITEMDRYCKELAETNMLMVFIDHEKRPCVYGF